ncbi:uncharacterized protein G2W53_016152 [Senna tora]|uniref:Uncharacterized protein n=1 Tax=Senna tora TaxID=362788 RepID=A0A835C6T4_9FABA|nr:uncharacterized protein G2W53_016152 [Senna tora]
MALIYIVHGRVRGPSVGEGGDFNGSSCLRPL